MAKEWKTVLWHAPTVVKPNRPIAAFDFDSTLREHKSKGAPIDLAARFISHMLERFNVVIFTNTSENKGDERVKELDEFAAKITELKMVDGKEVAYYISTAHDYGRKPHTGMWELYKTHMREKGYEVVKAGSFFCGDAAGRPKDFSSCDAAFAHNCALKFYVPEKFFGTVVYSRPTLEEPNAQVNYTENDIKVLTTPQKSRAIEQFEMAVKKEWKQVCVIMVGCQASGKTTVANKIAALGYTYISGDAITQEERRLKEVARYLALGSSVVIDATHWTKEARKKIIDMANPDIPTIIVHMTTSANICHHLNAARCEKTHGNEIPEMALCKYWKELQEPEDGEANAILRIPFVLTGDAPKEVTAMRYSWRKTRYCD